MSVVLGLLPLVVAIAVVGLIPLSKVDDRVDTRITRISRRYFGRYVAEDASERRQRLRAAYIDETYRSYAARTYFVTVLYAVAACIVGVYVFGGILLILPTIGELINALPDTMASALGRPELDPELTANQVFAVVVTGGLFAGVAVGAVVYWLRWQMPTNQAEVRRRGINEGLPRTVAFVYALSRGGMAVPKVMRTLADNRDVYGDAADEVSVAVREMDLFGSDMITAVRNVSERTPSEQFKTFSENLASVLQSGQSLSDFLHNQYERYRDEAAERQEEILELLATIAEAYVTTLVAGTLFLITILLVFGLTTTDTLWILKLLAYVMIPLANIGFIVFLDQRLSMLGIARGSKTGTLKERLSERATVSMGDLPRTDGGETVDLAANRHQLSIYDSVKTLKEVFGQPVRTLLWNPTKMFYVSVPLALLWIGVRAPKAFGNGGVNVRLLDDVLIQSFLFVIGTFAIVWEVYRRRIAKMEAALPELLERLASLNEAGMSVVESVERVRDSDLGILTDEIERIWRDLQYGATVDDAFRRFGLRVRTTATTRVVSLVTNALQASGNMGPVLRIAAEQAESELRLRRQRRQQMLTYLIVIYISFLVFLVIIVAVQEVLVPSLPNNVPVPSDSNRLGVNVSQFARLGQVNKAAYTLVFFHTALVQSVMSGFIGGQLGEGSLKDGTKHASVMLATAYLAFILLSSPVAQMTFQDQQMNGNQVTIESVSMSEGGFVVVREISEEGDIIGHSQYLEAGSHENVPIEISNTYADQMDLVAVPHLDTNGNERFDFDGGEVDRAYPSKQTAVSDSAVVTKDGSSTNGFVQPPARSVTWKPAPGRVVVP